MGNIGVFGFLFVCSTISCGIRWLSWFLLGFGLVRFKFLGSLGVLVADKDARSMTVTGHGFLAMVLCLFTSFWL